MKILKNKKLIMIVAISLVVLIAIGAVVAIAINSNNDANALNLPPREYVAERGEITIGGKAQGSFRVDNYDVIAAEKSVIGEFFVEQGDVVKKGDLLFELDLEKTERARKKFMKENNEASLAFSDSVLDQLNNISPERKVLALLNTQMKNPKIYADRDGVVLSIAYKAGDEVTDKNSVIKIGDMHSGKLVLSVTSDQVFGIEVGSRVQFKTSLYADKNFEGIIDRVSFAPNDQGNFEVIVEVLNLPDMMLDNLKVTATFIARQKKDILIISNNAIKMKGTKQYVIVVDEKGDKYQREIVTGLSDGKVSEIISGLSEGEVVWVEAEYEA